jgi:hypothetical protein
MKTSIAILMGSCSGLLISIMGSWVFFALNFGAYEATFPVLGCFVGGWIISSCFLLLGARTLSKVLARGFQLGAAEWLLMAGGGAIRASRMETMDGVGMMIAAGATAPLFMVALCLIGFAIVRFWRRKMEQELSTSGNTPPLHSSSLQAQHPAILPAPRQSNPPALSMRRHYPPPAGAERGAARRLRA